jgi:hypothetical protein
LLWCGILAHKSHVRTRIHPNHNSLCQLRISTDTDEWTSKVSHDLEEETQLIEAGFQLVRSINETTAIYKKRKQN